MKSKNKSKGLPPQFNSYEEAGEFWDKHDATDYLEFMRPVKVKAELRRRHVEIEIEPDLVKPLERRAEKKHTTLNRLANQLLRQLLAA